MAIKMPTANTHLPALVLLILVLHVHLSHSLIPKPAAFGIVKDYSRKFGAFLHSSNNISNESSYMCTHSDALEVRGGGDGSNDPDKMRRKKKKSRRKKKTIAVTNRDRDDDRLKDEVKVEDATKSKSKTMDKKRKKKKKKAVSKNMAAINGPSNSDVSLVQSERKVASKTNKRKRKKGAISTPNRQPKKRKRLEKMEEASSNLVPAAARPIRKKSNIRTKTKSKKIKSKKKRKASRASVSGIEGTRISNTQMSKTTVNTAAAETIANDVSGSDNDNESKLPETSPQSQSKQKKKKKKKQIKKKVKRKTKKAISTEQPIQPQQGKTDTVETSNDVPIVSDDNGVDSSSGVSTETIPKSKKRKKKLKKKRKSISADHEQVEISTSAEEDQPKSIETDVASRMEDTRESSIIVGENEAPIKKKKKRKSKRKSESKNLTAISHQNESTSQDIEVNVKVGVEQDGDVHAEVNVAVSDGNEGGVNVLSSTKKEQLKGNDDETNSEKALPLSTPKKKKKKRKSKSKRVSAPSENIVSSDQSDDDVKTPENSVSSDQSDDDAKSPENIVSPDQSDDDVKTPDDIVSPDQSDDDAITLQTDSNIRQEGTEPEEPVSADDKDEEHAAEFELDTAAIDTVLVDENGVPLVLEDAAVVIDKEQKKVEVVEADNIELVLEDAAQVVQAELNIHNEEESNTLISEQDEPEMIEEGSDGDSTSDIEDQIPDSPTKVFGESSFDITDSDSSSSSDRDTPGINDESTDNVAATKRDDGEDSVSGDTTPSDREEDNVGENVSSYSITDENSHGIISNDERSMTEPAAINVVEEENEKEADSNDEGESPIKSDDDASDSESSVNDSSDDESSDHESSGDESSESVSSDDKSSDGDSSDHESSDDESSDDESSDSDSSDNKSSDDGSSDDESSDDGSSSGDSNKVKSNDDESSDSDSSDNESSSGDSNKVKSNDGESADNESSDDESNDSDSSSDNVIREDEDSNGDDISSRSITADAISDDKEDTDSSESEDIANDEEDGSENDSDSDGGGSTASDVNNEDDTENDSASAEDDTSSDDDEDESGHSGSDSVSDSDSDEENQIPYNDSDSDNVKAGIKTKDTDTDATSISEDEIAKDEKDSDFDDDEGSLKSRGVTNIDLEAMNDLDLDDMDQPLSESSDGDSSVATASDISGGAVKIIIDQAGFTRSQSTSESPSESQITCSVITWNLAENSPSEEEASFLKQFRSMQGSGSDFVMFGGQETENTKPRRSEGSRSREIRRLLIKMLGRKYVPLALHSLGGVQFALFCKRSIIGDLEHVSIADVACGIGNVFHNKGAIGAFIQMKARNGEDGTDSIKRKKSVKMLLVACHLAAHVKKVEDRNADYWRIVSELEAQAPPTFIRSSNDESLTGGEHLLNSMDHILFCGDLNYRLDLPRELAERTVDKIKGTKDETEVRSLRTSLLRHDQLLRTISEGAAFCDFSEGEIKFPPTFKFDKGTKDYDTSHKQRIPAWTDRILYKYNKGVKVLEYDSVQEATHSDHRPVFGTFGLDIQGKEVKEEKVQKKKKKRRKRKTAAELD